MYQKCQKKGKTLRKVKAAAAQATAWPAGEQRQEASRRPQGQGGHLPLAPHVEAAGGSQQEFPAPPGRAWHSATARGGLGRPEPASAPRLAGEGRLNCGWGSSCSQPSRECRSKARWLGLGTEMPERHPQQEVTKAVAQLTGSTFCSVLWQGCSALLRGCHAQWRDIHQEGPPP